MTGYGHALYARSLRRFGEPRALRRSGGWILQRAIDGSPWKDATGPYPLFACDDWAALTDDLAELEGELVSIVIVPDPFAPVEPRVLERAFPDFVRPFKHHFVADLRSKPEEFISSHHRRNARKALSSVRVGRVEEPAASVDEWIKLYDVLVRRHDVSGIAAFGRESFVDQLNVPGIVALRATADNETVGMLLWYVSGGVAYYHLGAYSERGYALRASFALFRRSMEVLADEHVRWLALGGGAGISPAGDDGLARFKRGWSTGVRTAFVCGRILDRAAYAELSRGSDPEGRFFPAYRDSSVSSRSGTLRAA